MKTLILAITFFSALAVGAQTPSITADENLVYTEGTPLKIEWALKKQATVIIQIVNQEGRVVRTLDGQKRGGGKYSQTFDGRDFAGKPLPAGGSYKVRFTVDPTAAADLNFGVGGILGTVRSAFIFKDSRVFSLDTKPLLPGTVVVKVDGEEWKITDKFIGNEPAFTVDVTQGTISLNPAAELQENADVEVTASAGLPLVNPWDLQTTPDGNLFIVDNAYIYDSVFLKQAQAECRTGSIYKVSPSGVPINSFGVNGELKATSTLCNGLAVAPNGDLYLSTPSDFISVTDSNGTEKFKIKQPDTAPVAVTENTTELVGLAEVYGHNIFASMGKSVLKIAGIALNEKNQLFVTSNRNVGVHDASKSDVSGYLASQNQKTGYRQPPVEWAFLGPCIKAGGDYFYQTTSSHSLVKFRFDDKLNTFSKVWETSVRQPDAMITYESAMWHPIGFALDGSGLIYIADRMNHRIDVFFDSGDSVKYVYCFGAAGTNVSKLQMLAPHAIAISPDNKSLYIADDG
ncbi:MAG: FlgD immunoglobulin-like domain containing protein, partial [Chthoniobacterales bacterium]